MLIYIPTITMGIWADERKQGTDELLLTIPATDFDIVLGKYLAAWASSRSRCCSRWFAATSSEQSGQHRQRIRSQPRLDLGLFLGTYAGYWLVGVAMLGIGLVASFLTGNITIGFVLGVLFNVPLVFCRRRRDSRRLQPRQAGGHARWSIGGQLPTSAAAC